MSDEVAVRLPREVALVLVDALSRRSIEPDVIRQPAASEAFDQVESAISMSLEIDSNWKSALEAAQNVLAERYGSRRNELIDRLSDGDLDEDDREEAALRLSFFNDQEVIDALVRISSGDAPQSLRFEVLSSLAIILRRRNERARDVCGDLDEATVSVIDQMIEGER